MYQTISRNFSAVTKLILLTLILSATLQAQSSSVDLSFNAVPDKNSTSLSPSPSMANFILQPDNKIIVFGSFQVANGVVNNGIARLNTDGSLDNTFNCAICNFTITSAILHPDGKIIITVGNTIYRLNSDGSLNTSFTSPCVAPLSGQFETTTVRAIQPDGKILAVIQSVGRDYYNFSLCRINPNGTLDNTFAGISIATGGNFRLASAGKISVLPDGKILVADISTLSFNSPVGRLRRFNADGTLDSTFETPSLVNNVNNSNSETSISDFDVQEDGNVIIVGRFTGANGVNRLNVVRLLPTGIVDLSFNTPNITEATRVKILPGGKVLISNSTQFYRVNANGILDNSFASPTNITLINNWMLDSAGRIVLYGTFLENGVSVSKFARLNQDGSVESSFTANFGFFGKVTAIAAQPDGKVIFAGDFIRVNGVPRISIARVNTDGSLDTTFSVGTGFSGTVSKIIVQPDGKILVVGYNNTTQQQTLTRLNINGSLDTNFNPNIASGGVGTIALQPDGKIFIGGNFSSVSGQPRNNIALLNADGSLNAGFNPTFGGSISSIVIQSDGKILVGGSFSGVNGVNRTNLVRLNADGTIDASFNAGSISGVRQIELLTDGRYLALTNTTIVRLGNNGAADTTFSSPTFSNPSQFVVINQFLAQSDGSILVGGYFSHINNTPRSNFARLRPNGTLDNSFFPDGANGAVRTIVRQTNGQILVGGDFTIIGGVTRLGIARLNVNPFRLITPFDFDGDGRADVSVFRPSNGFWYQLRGVNNTFYALQFGQSGDLPAPADYDGDGKTDITVFRGVVPGAGNSAYFYITRSSDNSFVPVQFGATGDVPVSGDWDGDGKGDLAVYRDGSLTGGQSFFYYRPSSQPTVNFNTIALGVTGDRPLVGDFDGDGRLDPAVFRQSTATWIILKSSVNQITQTAFGLPTDIPAPADFDGDGMANLAVFRPSNGFWYIARPTGIASQNFDAVQFGVNGDRPVPADYDGDGKADVAVFRPSNGSWYILRSTEGLTGVQFGTSEDRPIPNAYIY